MSSLPPKQDFIQAREYLKEAMLSTAIGVRLDNKVDDAIEALYMAFKERYDREQSEELRARIQANNDAYERYLDSMEEMGFPVYRPYIVPTTKEVGDDSTGPSPSEG